MAFRPRPLGDWGDTFLSFGASSARSPNRIKLRLGQRWKGRAGKKQGHSCTERLTFRRLTKHSLPHRLTSRWSDRTSTIASG
ncbi:hypothetical protein N9A93_01855 [Akkermansiaceae bacterium]|nr:hypothetical protein [Akkermansiaceae bacterium]